MKRRNVLVGLGASLVAGCSKVGESQTMQKLFGLAEDLHRGVQRTLSGRQALAREFSPGDISPTFRGNGTTDPGDAAYSAHAAANFADWKLAVTGLVERPFELSLDQVRALPQRTQITRHDCVEGWSAIGQWTGPQLKTILDMAKLKPEARYIIFHCADMLEGALYYESVDLVDAFHPQTIVAHQLNGEPLPVKNGAPLRMRIERQLGYKHAKYLNGIEAVASLDRVGGGKGGFWEDRAGYQWYAGI
jgi:DMSO/TMAO reductase YedYZ molybdopterin-dependent catalytic subunit